MSSELPEGIVWRGSRLYGCDGGSLEGGVPQRLGGLEEDRLGKPDQVEVVAVTTRRGSHRHEVSTGTATSCDTAVGGCGGGDPAP